MNLKIVEQRLRVLNWEKWKNNTIRFLVPLGLTYLFFVQDNLSDGFAWGDLALDEKVIGASVLYIVNVLTDLLLKYRDTKQVL